VPLCALVLISNLSSLLLCAWFPFGAELFNHAGWFLMKGIEVTTRWSAKSPGAYWYVAMPGVFTICVYYSVLLAVVTGWLFRKEWRAWRITAVAAPTLVWCILWLHQCTVARLTVLPLAGGVSAYARLPGAGVASEWLIDCGDESRVNGVTMPFLRSQGVNRIQNFLLTHGENSYTGGAGSITEQFRPKNIYASPLVFRSPTYRDFQKTNHLRTEWKGLQCGDHAGPWTVLHPSAEGRLVKAEDNALVLRGDIAGVTLLLLSDLGHGGQRALLERTNTLRADIVVAAIPSEGDPLTDTLLECIQPRLIIIADSGWPATRRAGRKFRDRLAHTNVPVVYESDLGAITVEMHAGKWTLRDRYGARISPRAVSSSQVDTGGPNPTLGPGDPATGADAQ